jgi:hypothetical protein
MGDERGWPIEVFRNSCKENVDSWGIELGRTDQV